MEPDRPKAELHVEDGPDAGQYFTIRPSKVVVVGREGNFRLQDPTLSRRQAEIAWNGTGYVLRDLGSRSGTFLNERQVKESPLADGDRIRVGAHLIRFHVEAWEDPSEVPEAAPAEASPATDEAIPVAPISGPICQNCRKDLPEVPPDRTTAATGEGGYCRECRDEFPLLGTVLANYRCDRVLGSGGMGVVYRAAHAVLGRPAAFKVLKGIAAADPVQVQRLLREATAAGRVRHPNIVEVLDTGEANGTAYVVMELVEAEDLATIVERDGKIPPGRAVRIGIQVAEALAAAFGQGFIHRDIKPENILLTRDGRVKVTDFGLAKNLKEGAEGGLTQTGQVLGTMFYIAPEGIMSSKHSDQRADIYSLGATLYTLMAGRPPFFSREVMRLIMAIRKEEPPALSSLVPGVPAEIERIVMRCLRKEPGDRYQTPEELLADLRRVRAA